MATQLERREGVERLVADEVGSALARHRPGLAKTNAANTAQIVATVAGLVSGLTAAQQERIRQRSGDLAGIIAALADEGENRALISPSLPAETEPRKGTGFGELVDREESLRRLADYAVDVALEDWAGPVAGATALAEQGIARSTLHSWQQRGEVIGLLKGARRHVFPTDQFVDGRPAQGVGTVLEIAGAPRIAWFWLAKPSPLLRGERPIDLLKRDRLDEVVQAARAAFERL
jgi:hypothetical protein